MSLDHFFRQLNYRPHNAALFEQALTHRSFSRDHNERLEFLGDAVLDLVIGEALYRQLPDKREGELSRFRADLVNGAYLAVKARQMGLHRLIRLGSGERKTGGADRDSILAGAFEAVFGALYLDAGYEQTRAAALAQFADDLAVIDQHGSRKDAKTRLQESLQAAKRDLPVYRLLKTSGQDHRQTFTVQCEIADLALITAESGSSKKMAEQNAAESMLALLQERNIR